MNKKSKHVLLATIVLVVVAATSLWVRQSGGNREDKSIDIKMIVNKQVIYHEQVDTKAKTLMELLKQLQQQQVIQLTYQTTPTGSFITGIGINKLYTSNKEQAWVFDSKNNKQCKQAGFCDAMDNLKIYDQDIFVFERINLNE